jgi:predicted ArsR family transcriptional regulator
MTPCTQWIGGSYPAAPSLMVMMTPIQHNRDRIKGLLPLMKSRPGLCYEEIGIELGMTKKAVAFKMDKLQIRGVVWFKHVLRADKNGTPHKTKTWFTYTEEA